MLKKLVDNSGFVGGLAFLVGMLFRYFMDLWTPGVKIAVFGGLALIALFLASRIPALWKALGTRSGRKGSTALISLLLILGIIVLINFLNYRHHERWDLSEGDLNTLSDQTLKVVANLDGDVEVIGFFESREGSTRFNDLMKEYRFASSRIKYEVVDPQKDPGKVASYQIERNGQIVVASGGREQKIDLAEEEEITNAIVKVTREAEKVVFFLQGHGERSLNATDEKGYLAAKTAIEKQNYRVQEYNLSAEGKLPENPTLLVAAGPETNFLPNEVEMLEKYLAAGGKLLLLVDPQNRFSMNEFLEKYGIKLDGNVVIDFSGLGQLIGQGPVAPLVTVYRNHPITAEFATTTVFHFAQSVETVDSSLGYQSQPIFSTSARSWGETNLVGDRVSFDEGEDKEGPLALAAVSVLAPQPDEIAGDEPGAAEGEESGPQEEPTEKESRLVVVGDADFAANGFIDLSGNSDLFLNMVSWLAQDEDLIAVRPKDPTRRQVTLTGRDTKVLFWGPVVFLPLATLILGISIWYRRR